MLHSTKYSTKCSAKPLLKALTSILTVVKAGKQIPAFLELALIKCEY